MKRLVALIVAICFLSALASCSADDSGGVVLDDPSKTGSADELEEIDIETSVDTRHTAETVINYPDEDQRLVVASGQTLGKFVFTIWNDLTVEITGYNSGETDTEIVIPDRIGDTFVTEIDGSVFSSCKSAATIMIPPTIEKIGAEAFAGTPWFNNLTDEFVIVGNGVLISYRGQNSEVVVPDTARYVSSAFYSNNAITKVTLPETTEVVGECAFFECTSLKEVIYNGDVTSIGDYAFSGASSLEMINVPDTVTNVGFSAYNECIGATEIHLGTSLSSIGNNAFSGCDKLTVAVVPNNVNTIGGYAFSECPSLREVVFPSGAETIRQNTFTNCTGLEKIELPMNIEFVGVNAFTGCVSLKTVVFKGTETEWKEIQIGEGNENLTAAQVSLG